MKYLLFGLLFILISEKILAQDLTAKQIDQKMTEIRENTNWDDPAAAIIANDDIKKLSDQLLNLGKKKKDPKDVWIKSPAEQNQDYNVGIFKQMMKSVEQGKGADLLLGEPLRKEIVEEYKEDQSPKNLRKEYLQEMTVLVIDMSLPTVQRTIDIMENYKSIKTLVITGGEHGAPVQLNLILSRAAKFPLKNLYIINFRNFVSSIPTQVNQFTNLSTLGIFNNHISQLPDLNGFSSKLDSLFIDINPITTLYPKISSFKNLKKLGLGKTSISEAERNKIQSLLPNCLIVEK